MLNIDRQITSRVTAQEEQQLRGEIEQMAEQRGELSSSSVVYRSNKCTSEKARMSLKEQLDMALGKLKEASEYIGDTKTRMLNPSDNLV